MASYYEALPIFRAAMDCAVRVDAAVQKFPKGQKYALGGKLREACAEILLLVARANRRAERGRWLPILCDRIEEVKLLCQLGKEVHAFESFGRFGEVMEQVVALARQAEGWRRSESGGGKLRAEADRPKHPVNSSKQLEARAGAAAEGRQP